MMMKLSVFILILTLSPSAQFESENKARSLDEVNECEEYPEETSKICGEKAYCVDKPSDLSRGFQCVCKEGYYTLTENSTASFCANVDECITFDPCDSINGYCVDMDPPDMYACGCDYGFVNTIVDGEHFCEVDLQHPCFDDSNDCDPESTFCVPLEDGYSCDCKEGFVNNDGTSCEVLAAAEAVVTSAPTPATCDTHFCDPVSSYCQMFSGLPTCLCNEGFFAPSGRGGTCLDINECESPLLNHCADSTICVNKPGTYSCFCKTLYCSDGYRVAEGSPCDYCANINECVEGGHDCTNTTATVCVDLDPPEKWICVPITPSPTPEPTPSPVASPPPPPPPPTPTTLIAPTPTPTGNLTGTVFFSTGNPVPNAQVTVYFPETAMSSETTSDATGVYLFLNTPADGTLVVVAFDPSTSSSGSTSAFLTAQQNFQILDIEIPANEPVQPAPSNFGFSSGFDAWEISGAVSVASKAEVFGSRRRQLDGTGLTCQPPTDTDNAAVISTAGSTVAVGKISQKFVVPENAQRLEGRILFLSNEWPVYYGSQYNDNYLVSFTGSSGTQIVSSNNLNSLTWTNTAALGYNGKAPEVFFNIDISGMDGEVVALYMEVRDVGDMVVDSALAIADLNVVTDSCHPDIEECSDENQCVLIDPCKNPQRDTCYFYGDCLEAGFDCGVDGYPLNFGDRFCNVFLDNDGSLSPSGQEWSSEVRLCLQDVLVPKLEDRDDMTCSQLESFAFDSHVSCYLNKGVCAKVSVFDGMLLLYLMRDQVLTQEFRDQFLGVLKGCANELAYAISVELSETGGFLKDLVEDYLRGKLEDLLPTIPTFPDFDFNDLGDNIFLWRLSSTSFSIAAFDASGNPAAEYMDNLAAALAADENQGILGADVVSVQTCSSGASCDSVLVAFLDAVDGGNAFAR